MWDCYNFELLKGNLFVIKRSLATTNFLSALEPPGILKNDGKRANGMSLIPWKPGKPTSWDFTCSDKMASSHLNSTSKASGIAAHIVEYLNGKFAPQALVFKKEIGKLFLKQESLERRLFLFKELIELQKGNVL